MHIMHIKLFIITSIKRIEDEVGMAGPKSIQTRFDL